MRTVSLSALLMLAAGCGPMPETTPVLVTPAPELYQPMTEVIEAVNRAAGGRTVVSLGYGVWVEVAGTACGHYEAQIPAVRKARIVVSPRCAMPSSVHYVLMHELGHALGLGGPYATPGYTKSPNNGSWHSPEPDSIMGPTYRTGYSLDEMAEMLVRELFQKGILQ